MSYGNWKHILGVFSFQNSVSNGIFVIKHALRDLLSVLCQVRLSLSQSPPTAFSFTPKTQPTKTLLHSQIQAYLFTLHPLYPATLTEPPPHPTHSGHSSDWRTQWRSSGLGFSFFSFSFSFLFFISGLWVWLHFLFSITFHRVFVLRLGSESISDDESFRQENCWCDFHLTNGL